MEDLGVSALRQTTWVTPRSDRYEFRGILGSGASGTVLRVYDRHTDNEVALKSLTHPEDAIELKREFRALRHLAHPNLGRLYDLEESEESCYFTMELVEGVDLRRSLCGAPPRPASDAAAVRACFEQLALGLNALHEADKLHRDIKPLNVLVERGGRVVILDFGLVMDVTRRLSIMSQRSGFAGTLAYTSPEQAWGQPISPASDWYSVGVMLYECLTARMPFAGTGLGALLERQHQSPCAPDGPLPDADPELAALAVDLLAYDPEVRPDGSEVLNRLRGRPLTVAVSPAPRRSGRVPFVGRVTEVETLTRAYDRTRAGGPAMVRIGGPSGFGKSALVEHFVQDLERREDALVLRSRCHPQESVRFEAIDGQVDDLSRFLSHCPREEVAILRPNGVPELVHVFPVLRRVDFGALTREVDPRDADPLELRRRAFSVLGDLLGRVARRRPLVLWADDVQWGDRESAVFLVELLRKAPPPPLLLVISHRSDTGASSAFLSELAAAEAEGLLPGAEAVTLGPLADEETMELIQQLLPGSDAQPGATRAMATESGGSPFFLGELARYAQSYGLPVSGQRLELPHVLGERMRDLPGESASILEVVAVAGRPIETALVLRLAGVGNRGRPLIYDLCHRCWLRAGASADLLDTYHDRVRAAVTAALQPPQLRRYHLELGEAVAQTANPDGAEVLEHFVAAGDIPRAAAWAETAAAQADAALAFDRAAALYERAFQLRGERPENWRLIENRARALAYAGHSAVAAVAFSEATDAARRADVDTASQLKLRGREAQQYLYAGDLSQGVTQLAGVLADLGIVVPRSGRDAIRSALVHRGRFLVRQGYRWAARRPLFDVRAPDQVSESMLMLLDILQGASRGISMLDFTTGDALSALGLTMALKVGERSRALRALSSEAASESTVGGRWLRGRSRDLLRRIDALVGETGDPYDVAIAMLSASNVAWMHGDWEGCWTLGGNAADFISSRCVGMSWELVVNHVYTTSALAQLGRVRQLSARLDELFDEARSRGDTFGLRAYRNGDTILVQLAADDPEAAKAALDANWDGADRGPHTSRGYTRLIGVVTSLLYAGEGEEAWREMEIGWPTLRRSGFLNLECISVGLRYLRARAALAAAIARRADGRDSAALLKTASDMAKRVARSTLPHARACAAAVQAGVAGERGQREQMERQLEVAVDAFGASRMHLHAESARWQLGRARLGEAGRRLVEQAEACMASENVRRPASLARTLVPAGL